MFFEYEFFIVIFMMIMTVVCSLKVRQEKAPLGIWFIVHIWKNSLQSSGGKGCPRTKCHKSEILQFVSLPDD